MTTKAQARRKHRPTTGPVGAHTITRDRYIAAELLRDAQHPGRYRPEYVAALRRIQSRGGQ
jgi:hypothetical protein